MSAPGKSSRRVFVIMPFDRGGTRNEGQLTTFFQNNIKRPIERAELKHRYEVNRSGQTFDITAEIIRDLCQADIVIADLSGAEPNPNVMYELGVRLAIAETPVILIREKKPENKRIFDIHGFYTHDYDPYDYGALEKHLIEKLARLEAGEESYTNPVFRLIREELARVNPGLTSVTPEQQREFALRGVRAVAGELERAFGPYGVGLAVVTPDRGVLLHRHGASIALAMESANPFEEAGIRAMATCAHTQMAELGDGTKLSVIIGRALIDAGVEAIKAGLAFRDLEPHLASAMSVATSRLRAFGSATTGARARDVVETAGKGVLDFDLITAIERAGPNGIVSIDEGGLGEPSVVEEVDHPVFDRGAIHSNLLAESPGRRLILDDCSVLVCLAKLSSVKDMSSILQLAVKVNRPMLLVASDVEGDALSTLLVNVERRVVRCAAIKVPGGRQQATGVLKDLAVLTGATIIDPTLGYRLDDVHEDYLGGADRVVVTVHQTDLFGGHGDAKAVRARVEALKSAASRAVEHDRWVLVERIARLAGAIVTVRVGGSTADEVREKLYRARSAQSAFVAAVATGWVPGGGATLLLASAALEDLGASDETRRVATGIVRKALEAPLLTLVPSGVTPADIASQVKARGFGFGYNVKKGTVEDLAVAGIIDPVGVILRAAEIAHTSARAFFQTGAWHIQSDR